MKKLLIMMVWMFVANASAQTMEEARQAIEAMNWMTEEYPPYNYRDKEDGKLKGVVVDILMEMFKKIGVQKTPEDIQVLPWARGYRYCLEKSGSALFSTTYTVERLQLFKFVGPIIPTQVSIIANQNKGLKIRNKEDMDQLKIGVIRDDIGEQLIRALGVEDAAIKRNDSGLSMVQMLQRGRLDAVAYAEDIAKHQFIQAGMNPNEYEPLYVLQKSHMGYTFHPSTDPRILEPLRKALDELRADGTVDRIYAKYLHRGSSKLSDVPEK